MSSLRTKILLVLGILTLVTTTVLYFVLQFTILKGFTTIEQDLVKQNVQRISNSLTNYFYFLTSKTGDWARWDATYQFVDHQDDVYIRENLISDAFSTLDINFALYFNRQGKNVYSYGLDLGTKKSLPTDPIILQKFEKIRDAFKDRTSAFQGYVVVPNHPPILFVSYPIFKSDGSGPANGRLVFGRYFDENILDQLAQNTIFPLELQKASEPSLSGSFLKAKNELLKSNAMYTTLLPESNAQKNGKNQNPNTIEGYVLFKDIFNTPAFLLKVGIPREIHQSAEFAVFSVLILVVVAGIIFMGTVFFLMERLVLQRLFTLRKNVSSVSQNNYEVTRSIIISGSDEIFFLSWEIQNMLERLVISQENFRKTTERYRGILESQNEFIVRFDPEGILLFANDTYRRKFAPKKRHLVGQKFMLPVQKEDDVLFEDMLAILAKEPYRFSKEQRVETPEGWRWILWEFYAIRDQQDKLLEIQQIGRDITREKEVDTMKSEFISLASHQLRTPLTGIKWFTDLLLRDKAGALSAQQKDFIQQVAESNERMIKLVNDLLDISHIETGKKFVIQRSATNFGKILHQLIDQELTLAKEKNITIVYDHYLFDQLTLFVDEEKISQVFQNLLSNAIKYSSPGTNIEIGYSKEEDGFAFYVRDHGVGIPIAQQNRVFEKFFRADNVLTLYTVGTGLGLYITKIIIERHGGNIGFKSEENKGTTFYFSLPFKENTLPLGNPPEQIEA